ncbi:LCP family protein [Patescibacteria group bacterium]
MPDNYINFLEEKELFKKSFKKKRLFKWVISFVLIVTIFTIPYSLNIILAKSSTANNTGSESNSFGFNFLNSIKKFNILNQLSNFIDIKKNNLNGAKDDRINILILGIGGENHEGGQLTDTIILASLKPSTKQVSLISIPRDLSVPIRDYGFFKINTAHAFGEYNSKGEGIELITGVIENITGQPIHYYVRMDFMGFEKIIDHLGKICLDVENDLIDYKYPILGKELSYPISDRFEYLKIEKGYQCMDGSLSLKYARSRHSLGIEGSDFARAKRQQKILTAVKEKTLSLKTLLNPKKVIQLLNDLRKNISTDMKVSEITQFIKMSKEIDTSKITTKVLHNGYDGLLKDSYITLENGQTAYVLETTSGDFSEIQMLAENVFTNAQKEIKKNEVLSSTLKEKAEIEIQNGTKINGLASQTSINLKNDGLNVIKIGNALKQNRAKTTIYAFNPNDFKNTVSLLQKNLDADISYNFPVWINTASTTADILIVLGQEN